MLISDWSSDVCSSDLCFRGSLKPLLSFVSIHSSACPVLLFYPTAPNILHTKKSFTYACVCISLPERMQAANANGQSAIRSEEHTSELQSLMRISYAVFCLKKKTQYNTLRTTNKHTNK